MTKKLEIDENWAREGAQLAAKRAAERAAEKLGLEQGRAHGLAFQAARRGLDVGAGRQRRRGFRGWRGIHRWP